SQVWMPLSWNASLLPEAALLGFGTSLAGGVLGGMLGRALQAADAPRRRTPRALTAAAWLVGLFALAFPLPMTAHTDYRASVRLAPAHDLATGCVQATVQLTPPDSADHSNWFNVTS